MTTPEAPSSTEPSPRRHRWPWVVGTLAVVLVAGWSTCYVAGSTYGGGPLGRMAAYAAWRLDMTPPQEERLNDLISAMRDTRADMRDLARSRRTTAAALIGAETFDQNQAKGLFDEAGARVERNLDTMLTRLAALHASLSPEQRARLAERMQR